MIGLIGSGERHRQHDRLGTEITGSDRPGAHFGPGRRLAAGVHGQLPRGRDRRSDHRRPLLLRQQPALTAADRGHQPVDPGPHMLNLSPHPDRADVSPRTGRGDQRRDDAPRPGRHDLSSARRNRSALRSNRSGSRARATRTNDSPRERSLQ